MTVVVLSGVAIDPWPAVTCPPLGPAMTGMACIKRAKLAVSQTRRSVRANGADKKRAKIAGSFESTGLFRCLATVAPHIKKLLKSMLLRSVFNTILHVTTSWGMALVFIKTP
jgi:hypothetical protein